MTYEEVFLRYGIHPKFWAGMQACVLADARPDAELAVRLSYVANYRDCLRDLKAGTRQQPKLTPAIEPFQSIEVQNEQSDRFPGPHDQGG
jgi:hypothetical protein